MIKFVSFILLLSAACYTSCSDSFEQDPDAFNPVEGKWNIFDSTGILLNQRVYTSDFNAYFSIIDAKVVDNPEIQSYRVSNDGELIFARYTQTFRIDADTLFITNSSGDRITKYIRHVATDFF